MKQTKTQNWTFTSYDKKDKVIESFEIKDRTQSEATNEAIHYVEAHQEIADWTLQITPASKEPNTVGGDGFFTGEKWEVAAVKGFANIGELLSELINRNPKSKDVFNAAMYYRAKASAEAIINKLSSK